ncbi:hypothetical protein MXB_3232 [Myxobolus squamalis]|nr:hypothetical protein MXB_3232 [Myxobolus squamalis]
MTEMWRRNFWRDDRSANAISTAVFSSARDSKRPRVHGAARTAKKRQRQIKQTSRAIKRAELKHSNDQSNIGDTALIRLIYGPQEFAEKLFSRITKASNKFEFRLLGLEVLARIISVHKLIFPSFYQYCLKYLHPHQKGVVTIITTLAQASHELVPPEFITPVIERIANNFVSLQNAPEVCSVGINAIREIYFRVPLSVEAIIAQDLIQYARDRKAERSVVSAARSLLQLLRVVNPAVLSKKDKLYNTRDFEVKAYGSIDLHTTVPGAPFLSTSIDPVDSDWSDDESYSESHVIDAETCTSEILQDIDFKRLRILHKKTLLSEEGDDSSEGEQDEDNEIITNNNAIGSITSSKVSKCKAREERIKVNPHKGWRFNAKASTTNTEKKKNKPFAMAKNKFEVRKKKSRSFRERVSVLRRALDKKRRSKAKA